MGVILVVLIVAMGFSATPASARTLEVVALDKAKIAVENVQSMSVSVGGGYEGVSVEVSATFSSDHGFAFGAALAGIYDLHLHKYVSFGRDFDYAEKDYDTWGPIDITRISYDEKIKWTKGIELKGDPYGAIYVSTGFYPKSY
ncbi:MAG: hypothetical protein DRH06_09175 [Deltaproteobacteria bacterium]|nr:MAG: hypothetical protein DRH06_09175 [Deltaproteobacteria bacterium]